MIRLAKIEDTNSIMSFIDREWKKNHILSRNKDFFIYEHKNRLTSGINFVLSFDEEGIINGLLGFIPSSYGKNCDINTVIWKVSERRGTPTLGLKLLNYLLESGDYRTVMSVGINKKTIPIYKYLGLNIGTLSHYVMLNKQIEIYCIAKVNKQIPHFNFEKNTDYELTLLDKSMNFEFDKFSNFICYKDEIYFKKRYYNHPIYEYKVFGIYNKGSLKSILVAREQVKEDSKVLRIVDFIGDAKDLIGVSTQLNQILIIHGYEYIDFMNYGIDKEYLLKAGFIEVTLSSNELIIPNYFNPFLQENIEINFFTNTPYLERLRIFRGDGDQDRPN